ncbi:N-acetyl-gamma-glutamyl-phosphate reductase [Sorangium sp. So ce1389]|uniref:N-acetyl-gamma-glutamyl-phosphate reductase n=1 Tax=Sorangium sp. So ce1389 TaxID=3133336 RepID=UPI003F5DB463
MRVGVVGFRGYTGAELLRVLRRHPGATPVLLEHRDPAARLPTSATSGGRGAYGEKALEKARRAMSRPFDGAADLERAPFSPDAVRDLALEAVLLATPPDASVELAPAILEAGARVVDLSGAFRLGSPEDYERWYGASHAHPALLGEAVYGLTELRREAIRGARIVANPGCYATAASLALAPLVSRGLVDRSAGVACDAKSGVSGAGDKPTSKTHFCSVAEDLSPYGFLEHRHIPEILACTGLEERELSFITQLAPVRRGILASIHLRTSAALSWGDVEAVYRDAYAREPFVRFYPEGTFPSLHPVTLTNLCDLGAAVDPSTRRVIVVVAIDNLMKGAAGQAVQNLNVMFGLDETTGLV